MNSKTFCIAPWVHTCIRSNGTLTPCCVWKQPSNHYFTEFDSWKNSDDLKSLRQNLYQGVADKGCSECWADEKIGKRSLRKIYNTEFSKYFDFKTLKNDWTIDDSIATIDFKLGNLCNLKCVMCNGDSSSQLMTEFSQHQEKFQNLNFVKKPSVNQKFDWPTDPEFEKFLSLLIQNVRWIKFTGGEPTMIPYVIDLLKKIPYPDLVTVSLTTNATKFDQSLLTTLKKFKEIWITASLEGIEHHNDQIRYLSDWNQVQSTVKELSKLSNCYFSISHVLQCFSVQTLIPLLKWAEGIEVRVALIMLTTPRYLSLSGVNTDLISKFSDALKELHLDINQPVIEEVLNFLQQHHYDPTLEQQREQYLSMVDQIRGTELSAII